MWKASRIVFDEHVSGPGSRHYTADQHGDVLGRYDQLSIQATVDDVGVTGTLDLGIQHAGDGVHFVDKGDPLVSGAHLERGETMIITAFDAGVTPSLTYVRIWVALGTTTSAHVRIYVTMRDEGVADVVMKPRGA